MWTIGLTQSGNELGISEQEVSQLSAQEMQVKTDEIANRYRDAGAHFVAAGIWEVLPVIENINACLARGEKP
jgi:phosphonoacetaldehyde hydrolase